MSKKFKICVFSSSLVILIGVSVYSGYRFMKITETYSPVKNSTPLVNPYMGYAPLAVYKDIAEPVSLVYTSVDWRMIEKQEGVFDFTEFEEVNNFQYWREKNVNIIIRPLIDYPSEDEHVDVPPWLYEKIKDDGMIYDISYGKGFAPNYENETLIEHHRRFIEALGDRYNNDDFVAFVQIGSVGHWGEWHVNYTEGIPRLPTAKTLDSYTQPYIDYLSNKELLIRRPTKISEDNNIGYFNDVIGGDFTQEWLSWIYDGYTADQDGSVTKGNPDFWRTAFSGGEIANGHDGLVKYFSDSGINSLIQQIRDSHTSWIGPNMPAGEYANEEIKRNAEKLLSVMGYRLRVEKSLYNRNLIRGFTASVEVSWINEGVAPFYYDLPVEVSLVSESGVISSSTAEAFPLDGWENGRRSQMFKISAPLNSERGMHTLLISINDHTANKPFVSLGQDGEYSPGSKTYEIGRIIVR